MIIHFPQKTNGRRDELREMLRYLLASYPLSYADREKAIELLERMAA